MPGDVGASGTAGVSDAMSDNENECDDTKQEHEEDQDHDGDHMMAGTTAASEMGTGEVKKKYDPKDPSRPRRKKARRACFACQRAHLTCGKSGPISVPRPSHPTIHLLAS